MVKNLLIKKQHKSEMVSVSSLECSTDGIIGNVACPPLRQLLIIPVESLVEFDLSPGDLKENIIIDNAINLHSLDSGTVLSIGDVNVRLTFHCEPCGAIADKVNIRKITHKRGYMGMILTPGLIKIGDEVKVLGKMFETIPYDIGDRIKWYLDRQSKPVPVTKLVHDIGLSNSYCRAIPNIIKNRRDINPDLIIYAKDIRNLEVTEEWVR